MKQLQKYLFFVMAVFLLSACTRENVKPEPQLPTVPLIILDTDIGSSTDDLFAMQMLYNYASQGRCYLLGVVVDRMGDTNAVVADIMNNYYGFPKLPLALERNGTYNRYAFINYTPIAQFTDDEGNLMFARTYSDYSVLPDGYVLYRRLLAQAPDGSVTIMLTGIPSTIANLLTSGADQYSPLSGVELVRRKVKRLYFMATKLTLGGEQNASIGYNIGMHPEAASTLFELWPDEVDIILSPSAAGDGVDYTPEQVISDINWTDTHPLKQVYMHYDCNTGQRMWDPMLPIQEIEGEGTFALSPRGHLTLTADGHANFTYDPEGNCRFQMPGDEAWAQRMLNLIRASNRQSNSLTTNP